MINSTNIPLTQFFVVVCFALLYTHTHLGAQRERERSRDHITIDGKKAHVRVLPLFIPLAYPQILPSHCRRILNYTPCNTGSGSLTPGLKSNTLGNSTQTPKACCKLYPRCRLTGSIELLLLPNSFTVHCKLNLNF